MIMFKNNTVEMKIANKNAINIQITRGMCVFGATMLCCFFFFIILMAVVLILLVVMYSAGYMDMHIVINEINLQFSTVQRDSPSEILQNTIKLQEQHANFVDIKESEVTITEKLGVNKMYSGDFQFEDEKMCILQSPVILIMPNFTKTKENKGHWYSNPFFAFEGGYQMRLIVVAGGNNNNTQISVFLQLMKGPNDDMLQQSGHFPMYGYFAIELFSQAIGIPHLVEIITPDGKLCSKCTNRVTNDIGAMWLGSTNFASVESVYAHYLKNDSLHFRITYTKYSYYIKTILFCTHDVHNLLLIGIINGLIVYSLLTLVEFMAFCIQESSISLLACIDFSIDSIKHFLLTKQDVMVKTCFDVILSTVFELVKFCLIPMIEVVFLAIGDFMLWDIATAKDDVFQTIMAIQRIGIVIIFSMSVNQYAMSWGGKIAMINPFWLIIAISYKVIH